MQKKMILVFGALNGEHIFPENFSNNRAFSSYSLELNPGMSKEERYLQMVSGQETKDRKEAYQKILNPTTLQNNQIFQSALNHCKKNDSNLHILFFLDQYDPKTTLAMLKNLLAYLSKIKKSYLHFIIDGESTVHKDPITEKVEVSQSVHYQLFQAIEDLLGHYPKIKIGSISGNSYALDAPRGSRNSLQKLYDEIIFHQEQTSSLASEYLKKHFENNTETGDLSPVSFVLAEPLNQKDSLIFLNPSQRSYQNLTKSFLISQNLYDPLQDNYREKNFITKELPDIYFATLQPVYGLDEHKEVLLPQEKSYSCTKQLAQEDVRQLYCCDENNLLLLSSFMNPEADYLHDGQKKILIPENEIKNSEGTVLNKRQKIYALTHQFYQQLELLCYGIDRNEETNELLELFLEWTDHPDQTLLLTTYQEKNKQGKPEVSFFLFDQQQEKQKKTEHISLKSFAPSLLHYFGITPPKELKGQPFF